MHHESPLNAVIIVTPSYVQKTGYYYRVARDIAALTRSGFACRIIRLSRTGFTDQFGRLLSFKSVWSWLRGAALILYENIAAGILSVFQSRAAKVIVIHGSLHELDDFRYAAVKRRLYKILLKKAVSSCDYAISVSNSLNCEIISNGGVKLKLFLSHNLPDSFYLKKSIETRASAKADIRTSLGLRFSEKYICYSGNNQSWQNVNILLDCFILISKERADVNLLILTTAEEWFQDELCKRNIAADRFIIRSVKNSDVPLYLAAVDLLYMVRRKNRVNAASCPTKAYEYMCSGTPILASYGIGDISQLIADSGCGYLTNAAELESPRHIADDILRCLSMSFQPFDLAHIERGIAEQDAFWANVRELAISRIRG